VAIPTDRLKHEVHVWWTVPERLRGMDTLNAFERTLSSDERQQWQRFAFPEHRHRYLVSHALVRFVLSKYASVAPAQWRFRTTARGRPEIANLEAPALRFNLTHTRGLSACVVSLVVDCGIDAEELSSRHHPHSIARRMFSPSEQEMLQRLAGDELLEAFYTRWTLREAYLKARGIGIGFPTQLLHFDVDGAGTVSASFRPEVGDDAHGWRFSMQTPTPRHVCAVAVRQRDQDNRTTLLNEFVPGSGED
jgi:4'-phosphopantetheinyl transferase